MGIGDLIRVVDRWEGVPLEDVPLEFEGRGMLHFCAMKFFKPKKKLRIVIDIDGTVCDTYAVNWNDVEEYPEEFEKARPLPEAREIINHLFKLGYQIVFNTSRSESARRPTERWLKQHGFKYHHLAMDKIVGDVYIDDRCISGFSWDEVLDSIESMEFEE